jgi:hypothetical protein
LEADGRRQGGFRIVTDAGVEAVIEHYRSQLEADGFTVDSSIVRGSEGDGGSVEATHEDTDRTVTIIVGAGSGQTEITTSFSEPL